MRICPKCKSRKVITIDSDNDYCEKCQEWFPAVKVFCDDCEKPLGTPHLHKCDPSYKDIKDEIEKLKLFQDYSYYVGTEITCERMPLKFSPWLSERKKNK
jgi:predicted amidophosphoribosyltransferase